MLLILNQSTWASYMVCSTKSLENGWMESWPILLESVVLIVATRDIGSCLMALLMLFGYRI